MEFHRTFLMLAAAVASFLLSPVNVQAQRFGRGPRVVSPEVDEGKVTFRVLAPNAEAVRLSGSDIPGVGRDGAEMTKNDEGVWEITLDVASGYYRYNFNVDGVSVIDPRNSSTSESNANSWSLVGVPGAEWMDTQDVPHGAVAEVTYHSSSLKRFRRMHVYTPPGYQNGEGTYPVFYLLHGAFDCDDSWTTVGRTGFILDNLIAAGKAKAMIVVMTAGHTGPFRFGGPRPTVDEFSQDFVNDVMPYIEKNYRVKTDRASRALAGLSMGGAQTLNIGIPHLEKFAYLGVYSSGVFGIIPRPGAPEREGPTFEEQHKAVLENDELKNGLKLFWFATGKDDFLVETSRATVEMLQKYGFEVVYKEGEGGHTWIVWRQYLNEFAQQLFQSKATESTEKSQEPEQGRPSDDSAEAAKTRPKPVVFTSQQDRQNMLDQLGITKLRPGRSSNADSPSAANYDEAKANPYPDLPEVLTLTSGEKVTTAEQWWKQRRPEVVELLEREVYGRVPENVPAVRWEVRKTRDVEAGGKPAIQKHIVGVVDNSASPEIKVNISMSLTLPKDAKGAVPVLMSFGWTPFEPSPFARFGRRGNGPRPPSKRDLLIAAGWGCATLNPSTVQDDSGGWRRRRFGPQADAHAEPTGAGLTRGIIGITNLGQPRKPDQWGALRAWGWGASRALDYLENVKEVDSQRVGIAGVSRYGKAALVAMAFDQRFAMGLIASSGAGGTALYRRNFGESLENLATTGGYHWMAGNYLKYSAEESSFGRRTAADLPVDSHMTIALCAPRLTFISHGIPERGDAHWLDHQGSFMAAIAAQPVFRLLGTRDLGRSDDYMKEKMPGVNVDMIKGALAWRQHDGGHTDGPNVEHFIRWAETEWGKKVKQEVPTTAITDRRSLKAAVGDRFKIGVGISHAVLRNPEDTALIKQHFSILTPENCMKPQNIHPAEDRWNFEAPDRYVNFARDNGIEVVGHCLVWAKDDRTDRWMMEEDGEPVSRDTLLRRIEAHIRTVVQRYGDAVTMWDVVNEAVGDSQDGLLRDSVYSRTTGMDFIVAAFKAARANDPNALLIYNDYNGHKPGKRQKLIKLLTKLKEKGALVDAYGMQGHFELGDESIPQLRETFDELRKLSLTVVVSELDIDVVTRRRWWADGGKYREKLASYDPYKDGIPEDVVRQQTEQYVALFQLFDEYSDMIQRVSFWNLHDGQSWLNYFPWRRVNHPLLFDRERQPKPVFTAVYESLSSAVDSAKPAVD